MNHITKLALAAGALGLAGSAQAQVNLFWRTINGGGRLSSGGGLILVGVIGQPDAKVSSASSAGIVLSGGFFPIGVNAIPCYPDCDTSGGLSPADFTCFLGKYRAGALPYADCDNSGGLSPADFTCFLAKYRSGC